MISKLTRPCSAKSVIRELSEYATALRCRKIGYENVFDYSLGNRACPARKSFTDENDRPVPRGGTGRVARILAVAGHYLGAHGHCGKPQPPLRHALYDRSSRPRVRPARWPTHCARTQAWTKSSPLPPTSLEYQPYVNGTGAHLTVVPVTRKLPNQLRSVRTGAEPGTRRCSSTRRTILPEPSIPPAQLTRLAEILRAKQVEYGHDIFLISDEPYREIVFDGGVQPYERFYDNTLSCYSYSKSLSLPGERIGYVAVNPRYRCRTDRADVRADQPRNRPNCPGSACSWPCKVVDETSDLSVYEKNMNLLYDALVRLGFDVVRPGRRSPLPEGA